MADNRGGGGFGGGRGRGRGGGGGGDRPGGGRGGGFGGRRDGPRAGRGGNRRGGGRRGKKEWEPVTKLGRLVKSGKFTSLEDIFVYSIKIKEPEIIDFFFEKDELKDEIMKIKPVQKQTTAGQRTRFKAWVVVGDQKGHVGLGQKCAAEVGIAIRGAHTLAKLSLVPVRMGFWGARLGEPHTIPCKLTGKCGSARVRIIPAPVGTGLVAASVTKKMLHLAGIKDVYCQSRGQTRTTGNFVTALYLALRKTYKVVTPDMWAPSKLKMNPLDELEVIVKQQGY